MRKIAALVVALLMVVGLAACAGPKSGGAGTGGGFGPGTNREKLTPKDLSTIRGTNYRGARAADTTDYWKTYDPAETDRDLTYADRLKVNQVRVFVSEAAWLADKAAFRENLVDLAQACNRHRIGLMVTIGESQSFMDANRSINKDRIDAFVAALVAAVGPEPALAFWDASNEPDYNAAGSPQDQQAKRMEIARLVAAKLHELDKKTPVTVGVAMERSMEELGDAVDVLSFHDYSSTRAAIAANVARAKAFATRTGKQVMNTEIGCIARANPYDITLEEHMKANVGWYIWELMITKRWGNVHGVFYPDGTVRDPSIPAAMFGLFRNRGDNIILENLNRESWVNTDDAAAQAWLNNPAGDWKEGLDAAEKLANLLEAGQLIAMRELPTRTIRLLRQGSPDSAALREQTQKYIDLLRPFERAGASASTGVRPGVIPAEKAPYELYPLPRRANSRTPVDTSTIRGANYCYAEFGGHPGMWNNYAPATTERDLDWAQKLGINQIRTFITYQAYQANPEQYRNNLLHLVRAADQRGIGVMIVVGYGPQMQGEGHPGAEEWAKFLVDTLGNEPGLAFWDVYNEPDYPPGQPERSAPRVAFAKHMAGVFRRLDGHTPVTIGFAYEYTMEQCANDVDVLVYHGYQQTQETVRSDIEKARLAGAATHKQVLNSEIGCVCRANPYDTTIQEYMNARVGFYMWELMIVWNGRGWGDVHGVFYPDGTVRDPSIPMALMGIFRNRGQDVVLEQPNREGRVTRAIADARNWLANANGDWKAGLDAAEAAANLLESAQLVPLHELPTRQVEVLRRGTENRPALRTLLEKDIATLEPFSTRQ
jgi:phage tail protein X